MPSTRPFRLHGSSKLSYREPAKAVSSVHASYVNTQTVGSLTNATVADAVVPTLLSSTLQTYHEVPSVRRATNETRKLLVRSNRKCEPSYVIVQTAIGRNRL